MSRHNAPAELRNFAEIRVVCDAAPRQWFFTLFLVLSASSRTLNTGQVSSVSSQYLSMLTRCLCGVR